mmetsp:Transcript_4562/g.16050  ORF Transcript_4562/g.16050 Transcript_4562/m.16050 type:complete len:163 (+) Transcript_4562:95-583(+)|eukprot:CAMPEP_0114622640 /NCGR_PEP_ID=MMETSP0168-20121206/9841_1 /TAXON_ID=95228 ORGANISM="Vannella sp., Strain DIVA3 517/6/12" /NCGR_SAMPLE_ID=MMETSP0168 /ASSEMBLY_ACC=CAM_ASM_000044 /LENGTH=162 /DNA_ID=CAMNT_0001833861 /DNA_START=23 /DNA_END=511 /DNA_ORIENTATION=+
MLAEFLLSWEGLLSCVVGALLLLVIRELLKPAPPPPRVEQYKPKPKPEIKEMTLEDIKDKVGSKDGGADVPIYLAINGKVFDVSKAPHMYGPGSSYGVFAGNDCSYCLGTGSLDAKDLNRSTASLSYGEKEALAEWLSFFEGKYDQVGVLPQPAAATPGEPE